MIKSVVWTILVFLFAVVSSAVLITEKKKLKAYDERVFYFVSAGSAKSISLLDDKKELLKNLGGANIVYQHKGLSHLLASAYLEQESAEEIKSNLTKYFPESEILKLKSKRASNKVIKSIKNISGAENFIKYIYKISNDFQEIQMNYLSGEASESDFLSDMVKIKINFEQLLERIENSCELADNIIQTGEVMSITLTNFLNGLSFAKHKQNYVCNYFVGFYLNYVELFECL